jgi:hypothetical protein
MEVSGHSHALVTVPKQKGLKLPISWDDELYWKITISWNSYVCDYLDRRWSREVYL